MDQVAEEIQFEYAQALKKVKLSVDDWWAKISMLRGEREVYGIWPTGPTGHPRVLAVYRTYFLRIEEINDQRLRSMTNKDEPEYEPEYEPWGEEHSPEVSDLVSHADVLIYGVATKYPELKEIVSGFGLNPIGLDEQRRVV